MQLRLVLVLVLGSPLACSQAEPGDPQAALVKRGEQVYLTNCTACHARNPNDPGPVGPPIAGSSLELLQAKVLRNEYPPGYTPKRDSKAMIPLPHLEPELPAIAAFLQHAAAAQ
jgi:mono/diheme cytochrome c family protein